MYSKLHQHFVPTFTVFGLLLFSGLANAGQRPSYHADVATIDDNDPGLYRMRCALGLNWNPASTSCDGDAGQFGWGSMLEANSGLDGHDDLRLPTRVELSSLVFYSCSQRERVKATGLFGWQRWDMPGRYDRPAINQFAFPRTSYKEAYWSSERLVNAPVNPASVVGVG